MLLKNERLVKTGKAGQPAKKGLQVDNDVLSTVEHKYSLMDQQHARMRAGALASHNPDISGRNSMVELKFRKT